jgi:hypothetical protein
MMYRQDCPWTAGRWWRKERVYPRPRYRFSTDILVIDPHRQTLARYVRCNQNIKSHFDKVAKRRTWYGKIQGAGLADGPVETILISRPTLSPECIGITMHSKGDDLAYGGPHDRLSYRALAPLY